MSSQQSNIALEILKEYETAAGNRGTLDSHCDEIARRLWPSHAQIFQSRGFTTPYQKNTDDIVDATAMIANERFAAIMDSLLTPRNQTWHRVMASNDALMKERSVRLWFEDVNQVLFRLRYAPRANFASQNNQNFMALGAFGTGAMYIDELRTEPGFRYKAIHLGEIYFAENHQGIIDTAWRHFSLKPRQAVQWFGAENLPDQVRNAVESQPERDFFFVHRVKPRHDLDPRRADYKGMPFASHYVSKEGQAVVKEGGYTSFPYAISRYTVGPGEVYGRSPAMNVLPAIKTLNEQKRTVLKQGHKAVDPVLLAHDDGVLDGFSLRPGAINSGGVTEDGRPLVHALPVGNLAIAQELMEDERKLINDAFLINLFQILVENPQMTATEVMERSREKGMLIAPTAGRQQSEYLGTMIEREVDLAVNQHLLPPMPPALLEAKGEYRILYDSPLSRAMRAEEASGIMRTVQYTVEIVNITQDPAPLDHFDWDVIVPALAEIHGAPAKWMRDPKVIASMREGRAKQQQMQTAIQAAPGAAAMVKASAAQKKQAAGE